MMMSDPVWECVVGELERDVLAPNRIEEYLQRTGWSARPSGAWDATIDGARAWVPQIPADPALGVPAVEPGVINGLVQRQLTELEEARAAVVVEVLLRLEVIEDRPWEQIWAEILDTAEICTGRRPTLTEQGRRVTADLADLCAELVVRDQGTGEWWPRVEVELTPTTGITASPTHPRVVPQGMSPGDCWTVVTWHAEAVTSLTRTVSGYYPSMLAADVVRALSSRAHTLV